MNRSLESFVRGLRVKLMAFVPTEMMALASSNVVSPALTLLAMSLLTRWCSASDYGLYQLYVTTVTAGGLIACARFDCAIFVPRERETAAELFVLSLLVAAVAGVIFYSGFSLARTYLTSGSWYSLSHHAWILGLSITLTGLSAATTQWRVRNGEFSAIARSRLWQSTGTVGFQLAGAHYGYGGLALIAGDCIGRLAGTIALLRRPDLPLLKLDSPRLRSLGMQARAYLRFPLVSTPSAFINAAGFSLPVYLLDRYGGQSAVGIFSLIERVMGMPTVFFGQPLSQIFSHRFRQAINDGGGRHEIIRTAKMAAGFGAAPFGVLLIGGPWLFSWVFGHSWKPAGSLAQLLAPFYFLGFVFWPTMPALVILNRLKTQLLWDILRAAVLATAIFLVALSHPDNKYLISSIPIGMCLMYFVHFRFCLGALEPSPSQGEVSK